MCRSAIPRPADATPCNLPDPRIYYKQEVILIAKHKTPLGSTWLTAILLCGLVSLAVYFGIANPSPPSSSAPTPSTTLTTPSTTQQQGVSVHFLAVGKADCILLLQGDQSMLIDAGEAATASYVIDYLDALGIEQLTYLVASHPHEDHIGGIPAVLEKFTAEHVILPQKEHTTSAYERLLLSADQYAQTVSLPEIGDQYTLGDAKCTVLGPIRDDYSDLNDSSLVLKVTFGQTSFLLMGDAQTASERDLLLYYPQDLHADVLKVGHHGSNTSTGKEFLQAVAPTYAVITTAKDEPPADKVLSRLAKQNCTLYGTQDGTVVIHSDGVTYRIEQLPLP